MKEVELTIQCLENTILSTSYKSNHATACITIVIQFLQ